MCSHGVVVFFFFKQKTAYEMRISDWSSDVCSSDLRHADHACRASCGRHWPIAGGDRGHAPRALRRHAAAGGRRADRRKPAAGDSVAAPGRVRSEEHTSELQSLMRISYAVFCLKKKKKHKNETATQALKRDKE